MAEGAGLISRLIPKLRGDFLEDLNLCLKFKENMPEGPEVYLKRFYYDTALSASPHAFASFQTLADNFKIVFGTDYIFATQAGVPLRLNVEGNEGFNAKDIAAIEKENATGLFPRLKKE